MIKVFMAGNGNDRAGMNSLHFRGNGLGGSFRRTGGCLAAPHLHALSRALLFVCFEAKQRAGGTADKAAKNGLVAAHRA